MVTVSTTFQATHSKKYECIGGAGITYEGNEKQIKNFDGET